MIREEVCRICEDECELKKPGQPRNHPQSQDSTINQSQGEQNLFREQWVAQMELMLRSNVKIGKKIGVWVELDSSPTVTLAVQLLPSHITAAGLRFLMHERCPNIYCHDTYLIKLLWELNWAIHVTNVRLCLAHGCSIIYIIKKENNGRNGESTGISRLGLDNNLI